MQGDECVQIPTSNWNRVLTAVLGSFIAEITIAANALILIVVYKTTSLHSVTHYFIACLAVGDWFVGAVSLPLWMVRSFLNVEHDHPLKVCVDCVYTLSVAISTYNLCAVSLERYIGVVFPLRYNAIVTVQRFKYVAATVWVVSLFIACLRLMMNEAHFWILSCTLAFFAPGAIISYCYFCIFKEASRQTRSIADRTDPGSIALKRNKKAAITVAIVVGIFYISTLPAIAFTITEVANGNETSCKGMKVKLAWGTWALFLAFSNAALNPWIYAVRKREYRVALESIFCSVPLAAGSVGQ